MKRNWLNIFLTVFVIVIFAVACLLLQAWQNGNGNWETAKKEHSHRYETAVLAPDCTEQGYTTYSCSCGESYIADYTPALGHEYRNFTCQNCGILSSDIVYIPLHTAEDVYALSRIFASEQMKAYIYGTDNTIEQDLNRFEYPNDTNDVSSKIRYLSTAAYQLTSDISLRMQHAKDKTHFLGIGSKEYPFQGIFNGNGNTITLRAAGSLALDGDTNHQIGLFGNMENAAVANVNLSVMNDIMVCRCTDVVMFGVLAGYASESEFLNCNIAIANARVGVSFDDSEEYRNKVHLGGFGGECTLSVIRNSSVSLTDATLLAQGYDVSKYESMYACFSVGGFLGFSHAGSDNTNHIGRIGNRLIGCQVVSDNAKQQDVIFASIVKGDEVTAGGLVGCTFNNFVAQNCTVDISHGNIVAQKTGQTDSATLGTNAGGIIGRLEHTGQLFQCSVNGDYLNIISKSPENYSNAGGIVGYDAGPYHREVISLSHCSVNGNGTSKIILEITADTSVNKWNALGGIAGCSSYVVSNCSVQDIALVNTSENVDKIFIGGICGVMNNTNFWSDNTYFTPTSVSGFENCTTSGLHYDAAKNAVVKGTVALKYE